jgi:hypothetical protein
VTGRTCEVNCCDGLRWRGIRTSYHENGLRLSSNLTVQPHNVRDCKVAIADEGTYEVCILDDLRCHDMRTMFDGYRFRNSGNNTVISLSIFESAILFSLMGIIYKVQRANIIRALLCLVFVPSSPFVRYLRRALVRN